MMDSEAMQAGDLVKVDTGGPVIDGIVFEVLHGPKVVVAARDPARGPAFLKAEKEGTGRKRRA